MAQWFRKISLHFTWIQAMLDKNQGSDKRNPVKIGAAITASFILSGLYQELPGTAGRMYACRAKQEDCLTHMARNGG
jgi:hypothetical protein